jgi:predicted ATPase
MELPNFYMHRGELYTGLAIAEQGIGLVERLGEPLLLCQAHNIIGQLRRYSGDLAAARRHFEEGLALYDPERDRAKAGRLGLDSGMACHAWLGQVLWQQGFPDAALRHSEDAIAAARAASHPLSEAWALSFAAMLHQWRGEVTLCLERAEAAVALATEQVIRHYGAHGDVFSGWALVKQGRAEEGFARLRAGIDTHRAMAARVWPLRYVAVLAEACLESGRIEEGLSVVREALAEAEKLAIPYYLAELNRLEGELLLASKEPNGGEAEASFRKAIAIAQAQGAKSLELRAATSLARLLVRQGRCEEAHALLAPVYGWFTEGFDTADLIAAKALLGQFAP